MKIVDTIFSNEELKKIESDLDQLIDCNSPLRENQHIIWHSNNYAWQPYLYNRFEGHVLMHETSKETADIIFDKVRKYGNIEPKVNHPQFFLWEPGSGINWHADEKYQMAFTFYLQDWPIDHGGQLIIRLDGKKCIVPQKYNRMVINDNETPHMVTPVRKIKDKLRRTIQLFIS